MKGIIWDLVFVNVIPHIRGRPFRQGIEFYQCVWLPLRRGTGEIFALFARGSIAAGDTLILPLTRNPGVKLCEFAAHGGNFPYTAAFNVAIALKTE